MSTELDLEIEMLRSQTRDLKSEIQKIRTQIHQNRVLQKAKLDILDERTDALKKLSTKVKAIEDIPGVRTPRWYVVDIDFQYASTAPQFNSVQIAADGPFICTQIQPYYLVTDSDYTHYQGNYDGTANPNPAATPLAVGRYLPCTASAILSSNFKNLAVDAAVGAPGFVDAGNTLTKGSLRDFPEFSFKLQVAGSGTFWTQNKYVPAAAFYGYTEPTYLGVQGYVERTDRIVVYAQPETPIPLTGKVRMVLHGFQILGNIKISDMLGY